MNAINWLVEYFLYLSRKLAVKRIDIIQQVFRIDIWPQKQAAGSGIHRPAERRRNYRAVCAWNAVIAFRRLPGQVAAGKTNVDPWIRYNSPLCRYCVGRCSRRSILSIGRREKEEVHTDISNWPQIGGRKIPVENRCLSIDNRTNSWSTF